MQINRTADMKFEVGKKYRADEPGCADLECVAITTTGHVVFLNLSLNYTFVVNPDDLDRYVEIKEPVTKWGYVYKLHKIGYDDEVFATAILWDSEQEAKDHIKGHCNGWGRTFIKTFKVEYTEDT